MFQKKSAPASWPARQTTDPVATGFSMLGADVAIRGDISASADLHIDGRVEGDIACAALVQGEASEITGAIAAASARLAGTVRGSISVSQLTIQKSARIHGDVHYDQLTIEQGAQVEGRFAQREPAKELPGKGAVPLLAAD